MRRIFIASIAIVFTLCACQATPEEPVVIGKDFENMLDKAHDHVKNSPNISDIGIPEHINHKFSEGKVSVSFDASVDLPDTPTISVSRVGQDDFSQSQADVFWEVLVGDTPMYMSSTELTKSEIEEQILFWERMKSLPEDDSNEYIEFLKQPADQQIANLSEQYESAPDEKTMVSANSQLLPHDRTGLGVIASYPTINATSEDGQNPIIQFNMRNSNTLEGEIITIENEDGSSSHIDTISPSVHFSYVVKEEIDAFESARATNVYVGLGHKLAYPEHALKPEFTYEHAIETAQNFISQISAQDYLAVEEHDVRVDYMVEMNTDASGIIDTSDTPSGEELLSGQFNDSIDGTRYYVYLSRIVEGVPVHSIYADTYLGGDTMAPHWAYENIELTIQDGKIIRVLWRSPHVVTDTLAEQAALLPYEEIMSIFEKMAYVIYAPSPVEYKINIDRVELSLMRITEQNNIDYGILVPVWTFYGNSGWVNVPEEYRDVEGIVGAEGESFLKTSDGKVMIINAIDGSLIQTPEEIQF